VSMLHYPGLDLESARTLVGQPLGCTSDGSPIRILGASDDLQTGSVLEVEPWEPPTLGETDLWYGPAAHYAEYVYKGQHQPPTAGPDPDKERPTPP
jgi:hypothetical protein